MTEPKRYKKKSAIECLPKVPGPVSRVFVDPPESPPFSLEYATLATRMCRLGATTLEIADILGLKEQTIKNWTVQHKEFADAMRDGKEAADRRVVAALYHDTVKIFIDKGTPVVVPYREQLPPDTTAGIFWLKNRQPDKWRDVQKVEHEFKKFEKFTDEELAAHIRAETEAFVAAQREGEPLN